ncbi:hypothetical protein [Paenibacillus sp. NPDC093718]|uniref:hypothetical protein n=1 Tax=Paenibacillus sp. NPDC093718 TaxID=3390601 RepID=UPI003D0600AB
MKHMMLIMMKNMLTNMVMRNMKTTNTNTMMWNMKKNTLKARIGGADLDPWNARAAEPGSSCMLTMRRNATIAVT